jgi:hypothetical protein
LKIRTALSGLIFAGVLLQAGSAFSSPLRFSFTGVQWGDPYLFNNADNSLGVLAGQEISGSFTFDIEGLVDFNPSPTYKQIANPITAFGLNSISRNQSAIDYSSYALDSTNNQISLYVNDVHGFGDSDVFYVTLNIKPGVMLDENYDLATLKASDIDGFGSASNSRWYFHAATGYLSVDTWRQAIYGGYLTAIDMKDSSVPEPDSLTLIGLALCGLAASRKKVEYYF